jgi:iron complex outermembrane receptor protein/vitamin B12 transporter
MPVFASPRARLSRALPAFLLVILLALSVFSCALVATAATVRGVVTDPSGAKVTGANVDLVYNGKVIATGVSTADGSFQIMTGAAGRFVLVVQAKSFREVQTPVFYAGALDYIESNVVLEPEWVRESIVVTATGTPTPQAQTSAATSVISPLDLSLRDNLVSELRLMPGTFVVQTGQMGSVTSLFVRGGNSNDDKILLDGVDVGDMGNEFDFGSLSTTAMESAEVYRGTNSDLYGAGADSGVVSITTPRGTTSFPSLLFHGDAGSFNTSREEMEVAGAHNKLDYLGAFSWLQTSNDLPNDEYHVATTAANLGWQPNGNTQVRATLHYGVDATGVPNAWDFYHIADQATQKDQDLFFAGLVDNQTTADLHQSARYGATRKREQYHLWYQSGSGTFDGYGDSFGDVVNITGANGYTVTGQALLDYAETYPVEDQLVNNRDQLVYQADYRFTPHLLATAGFHYEDERGADPGGSVPDVERTNTIYLASVHGDFKDRFFYTVGGSLGHYSSFGTQTPVRAGLTCYALRPRKGIFSGTRVLFNFGNAVQEPKLDDQFYSLYQFLKLNGGQSTIQQLNLSQLAMPSTRLYEGGVEQAFFGQRLVFRTSFFHNEFGRQIEYVGLDLVPQLIPGLTAAQQSQLEQALQAEGAYELAVNSEAYRGLGVETTVEGGLGKSIFLRGGYTYLDAVVQRSFSNDDVALLGPVPTYNGVPNGIPIGEDSPLQGARPFRRAPNTGFITATYASGKITGLFKAAFASRSDDSDFLAYDDVNGGNSLLLPNRNLDYGYAKLDLGGSYQLFNWLGIYAQAENLTNNQHIAPIGYPSLPITLRAGLRLQWGIGSGK